MEQVVLEREGREPFTLTIDEGIKDDMEFFETLCELDDKNVLAMGKLMVQLLGKDQKKALYDWLRGENGRVKVTDVSEVVAEIFKQIGDETKK